uniref:Uncharacterized protein n=1 Tax=Timema poppense TaxID=170557 RepID=A0A7R9CTU7_TIMPO|nr:unnamed protein product [Timema poppensis]
MPKCPAHIVKARSDHRVYNSPTQRLTLPTIRPRVCGVCGTVCLPGDHWRARLLPQLSGAVLPCALQPCRLHYRVVWRGQ